MKKARIQFDRLSKQKYEQQLKSLRKAFHKNFEHAPMAMARFDKNMNYLFATKRWLTDHGLKERKIIGKSHYDLFPDLPLRWKKVNNQVLSGRIMRGEAEAFLRANGRTDYVNWLAMPWREIDQSIQGIDIISEVITDRIVAEREVVRLRRKLRSLVRQKTAKLNQLLQHEKDLSRIKSDLLAIASHELGSPLGAILSSSHLINAYLERGDNERIKLLVASCVRSAQQMRGTLNNFLHSEIIHTGIMTVSRERIDLKNIQEEMVEEFAEELKSGQTIQLDYKGHLVVKLDPTLIRYILRLLVSNAIKFSPPDSKVKIKSLITERKIKISVIDKGIGIPKRDLSRLSERNFRARNARPFPGKGLGLYIAYGFAKLLDGQISCRSSLGSGAQFTMIFKNE